MLRRHNLGKEGFIWIMVSGCSVHSCLSPALGQEATGTSMCGRGCSSHIDRQEKEKGEREESRTSYGLKEYPQLAISENKAACLPLPPPTMLSLCIFQVVNPLIRSDPKGLSPEVSSQTHPKECFIQVLLGVS